MTTMFCAMIVGLTGQIVWMFFSPNVSGWYQLTACLVACHVLTCLAVVQIPLVGRHIKDEIDFSRRKPSFIWFAACILSWCLVIGCQMIAMSFYWIGYGRWAQRK